MISIAQFTDAQLVLIYQKNQDSVYFGELYNRYYQRVYKYSFEKVENRDLAYLITADVFVKNSKHVLELKDPDLFMVWLFRIVDEECEGKLNIQ